MNILKIRMIGAVLVLMYFAAPATGEIVWESDCGIVEGAEEVHVEGFKTYVVDETSGNQLVDEAEETAEEIDKLTR